jgi:uncharacterized repeat protein (TIGR04138 family)
MLNLRSWFSSSGARQGPPVVHHISGPLPPLDPSQIRLATNGRCQVEVKSAAGKPRLALWQPAATASDWAVGRWFVAVDALCQACHYNLRALPFGGRCPECAAAVSNSVRFQLGLAKGRTQAEVAVNQMRFAGYRTIATSIGLKPDAISLIRDVISFGSLTFRTLGVDRDLRAEDVACSLAEFSMIHFGGIDEATLALASLGLMRSETVGEVVFSLVGQGLLTASPGDHREHFDRLFTLNDLFDGW